jgi:anti-anti-sigma factor
MSLNDWADDVVVGELQDGPALGEDLTELRRRIEREPAKAPHIVLDMSRITHLNSSSIAQMLRLRRHVVSAHRSMRICSVSDEVWSVMLATGLDKVFHFNDDVSTALAAVRLGL